MVKRDSVEKIDQFIQQEIKKNTFPGVVLGIVNDNKILYKKSFGYAQLEPDYF